jgi:hypothetical protein
VTDGTVTITAPVDGFVKLDASFVAEDAFTTLCTKCLLEARLHDVSAGTDAPMIVATAAGTTTHYLPVSLAYVFPVTKGAHSYSVTSVQVDTGGPLEIDNVVLIAQFVPFGSTGSPTTLAATGTGIAHTSHGNGQAVWRER